MFIDDILMYFRSEAEHEMYLSWILQTLREHQFYAKFSKCEFWLDQVSFLRHVIFTESIYVNPQNIEAVLN